jgi:hypothetical protein
MSDEGEAVVARVEARTGKPAKLFHPVCLDRAVARTMAALAPSLRRAEAAN